MTERTERALAKEFTANVEAARVTPSSLIQGEAFLMPDYDKRRK